LQKTQANTIKHPKRTAEKAQIGKGKGVTYKKIELYPNQSSAPNSEIIKDLARYGYIFWVRSYSNSSQIFRALVRILEEAAYSSAQSV